MVCPSEHQHHSQPSYQPRWAPQSLAHLFPPPPPPPQDHHNSFQPESTLVLGLAPLVPVPPSLCWEMLHRLPWSVPHSWTGVHRLHHLWWVWIRLPLLYPRHPLLRCSRPPQSISCGLCPTPGALSGWLPGTWGALSAASGWGVDPRWPLRCYWWCHCCCCGAMMRQTVGYRREASGSRAEGWLVVVLGGTVWPPQDLWWAVAEQGEPLLHSVAHPGKKRNGWNSEK